MFRRVCIIFSISCSILPSAFSGQQQTLELDPIIVTKSKAHQFMVYSPDTKEALHTPDSLLSGATAFSPLDLQSRSPQGDIQADFSLRGSSFQGVLILLNGQRINDPQTGHHNSDVPVTKEDIERIEVMPGVSLSLFGPDAIGGAVNFVLKKPAAQERVLEVRGGEHGTIGGLLSLSEKKDGVGVRLSLENEESSGFREDRDFKKFTGTLVSSLDVPVGEVNFMLGHQEKEFGAFDFYTPGSGFPSKEWTKTTLISTGARIEKSGVTIKPNFLWRRHEDKFLLDKTLQRSRYLNHHRTDMYTPSLYFQGEAGAFGSVGAGLEYAEEHISSTNLGKHTRSQKSLSLDESKDFNDALSGAFSFRFDDPDTFDRAYTGSASLKYHLSEESSVSLGISRNMRIPSFTELYYTDPTTVGDASLSPEKATNYQLGYDYQKDAFSVGVLYFFRFEEDFIDWIKRSTSQAKWQVENITEAEASGIEQYLRLKLTEHIELASSYTYVNKRIDDQGFLYKYGPNYASHLVNNVLTFRLPFGVQTVGLTYKKKPGRDGWCLMNTSFTRQLNPHLSVFLTATNLLNVEYQEIEGIAQPGRWVEGGLRLEW